MNETINSMLTRRSIRSYKTTQIPERDLNWILEAAIYAATSRNLQSWDFTVIQNKDMLKKLSKAAADTLRKMGMPVVWKKRTTRIFPLSTMPRLLSSFPETIIAMPVSIAPTPHRTCALPPTHWDSAPVIWPASRKRSKILLLPRHL